MKTSGNMRNTKHANHRGPTAVSPEEYARRREAMRNALVQVRLENMEPDPIFFEYTERYARGEITIEEAVADYTERVVNAARATARRSETG